MKFAIAVETKKHPKFRQDYRVWYVETNRRGDILHIGAKSREELIASIFEDIKKIGKSTWRAFLKNCEHSTPIELYDFICMEKTSNTHFGQLPSLSEFQKNMDHVAETNSVEQRSAV